MQAARKPNSVLDDHSSRRGVTDALDSNLPAGFDAKDSEKQKALSGLFISSSYRNGPLRDLA